MTGTLFILKMTGLLNIHFFYGTHKVDLEVYKHLSHFDLTGGWDLEKNGNKILVCSPIAHAKHKQK